MSAALLTSSFLECQPTSTVLAPVPTTIVKTVTDVFTTTYCVTLPAACPTSSWLATYTVREVCTGKPEDFVKPACPSNFVVTTVNCDVCDNKKQVITCPNALATGSAIQVLSNNGVTATVPPAQAVYPTLTVTAAAVAPTGPPPPPPGPNGPPAPPPSNGQGPVPAAPPPANNGAAPGPPANNGAAPPPPPAVVGPQTTGNFVTAGAPASLKNGVLFAGAIALAIGQFLV